MKGPLPCQQRLQAAFGLGGAFLPPSPMPSPGTLKQARWTTISLHSMAWDVLAAPKFKEKGRGDFGSTESLILIDTQGSDLIKGQNLGLGVACLNPNEVLTCHSKSWIFVPQSSATSQVGSRSHLSSFGHWLGSGRKKNTWQPKRAPLPTRRRRAFHRQPWTHACLPSSPTLWPWKPRGVQLALSDSLFSTAQGGHSNPKWKEKKLAAHRKGPLLSPKHCRSLKFMPFHPPAQHPALGPQSKPAKMCSP